MEEIHIGCKIHTVFVKSGLRPSFFAKQIEHSVGNIYKLFDKESINSQLLDKIGIILNHNFFQYYNSTKL